MPLASKVSRSRLKMRHPVAVLRDITLSIVHIDHVDRHCHFNGLQFALARLHRPYATPLQWGGHHA